jgi:hypothetical protein
MRTRPKSSGTVLLFESDVNNKVSTLTVYCLDKTGRVLSGELELEELG